MAGLPIQPGVFTGTCTLQKKIGAGPALSLPKKPHLGHQALPEAVTRHRQCNYSCLLCGRAGLGMCQRSWCRSGHGGDREAHLTMTSQQQGVILGARISQGSTASSLHLHAAHKIHFPRATSSFPNPSADSQSCYLKIK